MTVVEVSGLFFIVGLGFYVLSRGDGDPGRVLQCPRAPARRLRRQPVDHEHFRAPTVLPWLGLGSCVLLMTQQSADAYLRAVLLLAVGVGLYAASRMARRRQEAR